MLSRMKQCVSAPGSSIPAYDEGQMAIDNDYAGSDPESEIAKFQEARAATLSWLGSLKPADWSATAVHSERGEQSVYDIANTLVCHDVYHIEQLAFR